MINNEIPVFFSIDDSYAPYLASALNSAISNSSKKNFYKAIILHQELNAENKRKIKNLETENFKIEFVPMQNGLDSITDRMSNRLRCDYFTLTIYYRLFIPTMFPQYDKAIYIDSDVIVLSDLAELYNIDLKDNLIGACSDLSVVDVPPLAEYMEKAVGVDRHEYINSGVLLMNLKELRNVHFDEHFLSLLNEYHFDCIAPDQDYLNAICNSRILYLPPSWDAMPNDKQPEMKDAKLVHYNLFSKPWCYDNIQYSDVFWKYAQNCGYIDEIKKFKAEYTSDKQKADSECLNLLINRAIEIPENEITFKKVKQSGVKIQL